MMRQRVGWAFLALACSSSGGGGEGSDPSGGDALAPGAGESGSGLETHSGSFPYEALIDEPDPVDEGDCSVAGDFAGCVGRTYAGESLPLDIYVMFDQSGSMCSCVSGVGQQTCPDETCEMTRLDAVRAAAESFLTDPESVGIGVGLGLFGKQPLGAASCREEDYEVPAVPLGELPGHANALIEELSAVLPTGETPTGAALRGSCNYAKAHKQEHPEREVVILLLTDGKPEAPLTCADGAGACCPTLDDAVSVAAQCNAGPDPIRTYVLGVGPLLENLDEIASAGGTEHAYLVEGGDVGEKVLRALNQIRGDAAIPCRFALPPPEGSAALAYDRVNVRYADSACQEVTFLAVEGADQCGSEDGWHYDDPTAPTAIELCPASCDRVSGPGGQLSYAVGCATQYRIR